MVRTAISFVLVLAGFAGLGVLGWYFVKDKIGNQPEYRLNAEKITVPTPPDWVPERFVENVLRNSGLNRTGSLLDKALPQKLADAFAADPWVESVEHVTPRYPSGADIQLSYRVPVALVEVRQRGVLPVDRFGVVLPTEYLTNVTAERLDSYLIIQGVQSIPIGLAGTPWGDPLVQTAAQLAHVLTDIAEPLKLAKIIPTMEEMPTGVRIVCNLQTAAGTEFHWGAFVADESIVEAKKKKLWNLREQFQSLDSVHDARFRDLSKD
ncbi:MAG: hypothetical protein FWG73_09460 [Planctomycetaceae bacterium]|nr:hypothetical protein [Planctomycetaceae bacterium]